MTGPSPDAELAARIRAGDARGSLPMRLTESMFEPQDLVTRPLLWPREPFAIKNLIDDLHGYSLARYRPDGTSTKHRIFLWDITRALGCEIPPWVGQGCGLLVWMRTEGRFRGWHEVTFGQVIALTAEQSEPNWDLHPERREREPATGGHVGILVADSSAGLEHSAVVNPDHKTLRVASAGLAFDTRAAPICCFGERQAVAFVHE